MKKNSYGGDLIWNYGSLIIMSISGMLLNGIIATLYDASVLGLFNKTYAWYCALSQLTVFGIQSSVLKEVSEIGNNSQKSSTVLQAAVIDVFIISASFTAIAELVLALMQDKSLFNTSMRIALPGLILFSLNKVILSYFNGISEMRIYAVLQSIRYLSLCAVTLIFGALKVGSVLLPAVLGCSEAILFIAEIFCLIIIKFCPGRVCLRNIVNHIYYGIRIIPSNLVLELNTKVDVICLGWLLDDYYQLGIYSFAILFVEGFYQLYIVVRRIINPRIANANVNNILQTEIYSLDKIIRKYTYGLLPVLLGALAGGYYLICKILQIDEYIMGEKYLLIISVAIALCGRWIVWGNVFSQTGYPLTESILNVTTVVINFALDIVFILLWGAIGAAIATSISYIIYSIILKIGMNNKLKVNL